MKKAAKIIGIILLIPVVLIILLAALFYFPPFQNWAVRQVASVASEKTGMEISVSHVNLAFPLDLAVDGVLVLQPNDTLPGVKDTVADIQHTIVDIQFLPLLKSKVEVDELALHTLSFNTLSFVDAARVKGNARMLSLKSHGINLNRETVMLNEVLLDGACVDVALADSVPEDTTESHNNWQIALQKLLVSDSRVTLHMPGDSLRVDAYLGKADVRNGHFELATSTYSVGRADLTGSRVAYDNTYEPMVAGLDYNHLNLSSINIGVDSLLYHAPDLYVKVRRGDMKEQSGLTLTSLAGTVRIDSTTLYVPSLKATTSHSDLQASIVMALNAFDDVNPGQMEIKADAHLGKGDIMLFLADMPQRFRNAWPQHQLGVAADIAGNLQHLNINTLTADLPTAFKASADGFVANCTDMNRLLADLAIDATTYNINPIVYALAESVGKPSWRIPSGLNVRGKVGANGQQYRADLRASQGGGYATLKGQLQSASMTYHAVVGAHSMPLQHFLPGMGLTAFSGNIVADGKGTDFFSPRTSLTADAKIDRFHYADFDLSGTTANAVVSNGYINANVNCINQLLNGNISLSGLMDTKNIKATIGCSLDDVDFFGLGFVEAPLNTSLCAHVDVASDLDQYYKIEGFVSDVVIRDSTSIFRPEELQLDITTRTDTTWAKVNSGDFFLDLAASGGYRSLMKITDNLTQELTRQIDRKYISQDSLKQVLPIGHLTLQSGKNNFVARYADRMDYRFRSLSADITTSPHSGINGYAQADSLIVSGMQLDKVRLDLVTDEGGFRYNALVKNEKDNPDYCFRAHIDGGLFETGSDMNVSLYDDKDQLGLKLGLRASLEAKGIRFRLADTNAVLGYRNFVANADNYFFLADDSRVSAYMKLRADDGTGLQVYSDDENLDALQDITIGVHHLDLASIVGIIPYCPKVEGILDGDFHVIQTPDELSVSTSLGVDDMVYEGWKMGDLATEFVYIPREDGGHYVDGMLMHNGKDVGTIKGTYTMGETDDVLDAKLRLTELPLDLINGFIPDQIMGLKGYADGVLDIQGTLSRLRVNGQADLHDAFLVSVPYGVELRFDDRPVRVENSRLYLDDFNMYSSNNQKLTINGNIDFARTDRMTIDMSMMARNFLVIDSKEKRKSEIFGKTYINFDATIKGLLEAMQVRGRLDVLGTTDMTYIMRDTPLTTDNRLDELVKFTDLNDEDEEQVVKPTLEGLYVDLSVNIDQGARIFCALNANKSNYLDLIGGGNLRLIYKGEEMRLNGRYTITDGEMKYSLPVIPLQTFTIRNGSYVEFTGEVMNPTLNITATERLRSAVSGDGANRNVAFDCGVEITKTLEDMGLEFIIDAPEDMAVHGQLQTMSKEGRGKIAVTMLTTGMYLADGNTNGFSMNNALSSFLQSEINSITGNALRTLDLSIGLDNSTDATGALHTDYSFKFAKRFWDNRIRVVVGGKVSSDDAMNQNLFDNVAFEYRLDKSANTNLKLFYDRAVYDYLEGYVGEYGVGVVWSRKLQRLSDLLRWRSAVQQPDTTTIRKEATDEE